MWDVAYADGRREVTPNEQHVHGFLERVPLMATVLLTVLHWDQARSVFGVGDVPDWSIRSKRRRLSVRYRAGVLAAVEALLAMPYGEEFLRCLRGRSNQENRAQDTQPAQRTAHRSSRSCAVTGS